MVTEIPDIRYWLALCRVPGIGTRRLAQLLAHFAGPAEIFAATQNQLAALEVRPTALEFFRSPDWPSVDQDLRWLDQEGHSVVTFSSPGYPALLKEIPDPPPALFVIGDAELLSETQLAIVGSRNATHSGAETCHEFAAALARGIGHYQRLGFRGRRSRSSRCAIRIRRDHCRLRYGA
jgi:DNA processing protein